MKVVPSDSICEEVKDFFRETFKEEPDYVVGAPGRVNLIGEHTDYQGGFVMPIALDKKCVVAIRRRSDGVHRMATKFAPDEVKTFEKGELPTKREDSDGEHTQWWHYVLGAIQCTREAFPDKVGTEPPGFDLAIVTDVPVGAGLSSSASVEVSVSAALEALCGMEVDPIQRAKICQRAEHEWARMPCGLMDQAISSGGLAGHAMLLDCRSEEPSHVPLSTEKTRVLVVDSGVRHRLVDGAYALRAEQCKQAVAALSKRRGSAGGSLTQLRDATPEEVAEASTEGVLTGDVRMRAEHVTSENARCLRFAELMKQGDVEAAGEEMYSSHASLRDLYAVSTPEIDWLVDHAKGLGIQGGVYGARITGGGFGGCVVMLVDAGKAESVRSSVLSAYRQWVEGNRDAYERHLTPVPQPGAFVAMPSDGAHRYE